MMKRIKDRDNFDVNLDFLRESNKDDNFFKERLKVLIANHTNDFWGKTYTQN